MDEITKRGRGGPKAWDNGALRRTIKSLALEVLVAR
jgi:hypothetical protein